MGPLRLMRKELARRPATLILSVVAVIVAVAACVMTVMISGGLGERINQTTDYLTAVTNRISWEIKDDTRIIMRDIGVNLVILPEATSLTKYDQRRFPLATMPEVYAAKLANTEGLIADHYIGQLHLAALAAQADSEDQPQDVLVTGMLEELRAIDRGSKGKADLPQALRIRRDSCFMPVALAKQLGVRRGQSLALRRGEHKVTVRIERLIPERMLTSLDIPGDTVYLHLHTAQELMGGRRVISSIEALSCKCDTGTHPRDFLDFNAREIPKVLPGARMHVKENIWLARETMRRSAEAKGKKQIAIARESGESLQRLFQLLFGGFSVLLVVLGGVLLGLLMIANVRERLSEVGVLLAVGWRPGKVGVLFGGKALAIGLIGGILGILIGPLLAVATSNAFAGMAVGAESFAPESFAATQPASQPASRPATLPLTIGERFAARPSNRGGPQVPPVPDPSRIQPRANPWVLLLAALGAPLLTLAVSSIGIIRATRTDPALVLAQH